MYHSHSPARTLAIITVPLLFAPVLPGTAAVAAQRAPGGTGSVAAVAPTPPAAHYTVRPGDTLSAIARAQYGHSDRWQALWWANRSAVPNPDALRVGQHLRLTPWHPQRAWLVRRADAAVPHVTRTVTVSDTTSHPSASQPAPQSAPPPPSGGAFSYSQLEALWVSAGGPSWAAAAAATIAECESGGNPAAYNPSGASGLWQILGQVVAGNIFDPMVNALNAVSKFRASGDSFAQWVCQA